jgi:putative FmdB family regulatory protein
MPIYEYACNACSTRFDELRRTTDESRITCPNCDAAEVTRLFSSFATEWRPSNVEWHRIPGRNAHD